jgi:hypothetical protein
VLHVLLQAVRAAHQFELCSFVAGAIGMAQPLHVVNVHIAYHDGSYSVSGMYL